MPCAFCGSLAPLEDAHIKDEHVLISEGKSIQTARFGNIIPLCKFHHRNYFDCPRRDPNGLDEKKEYQFEPLLIIDFIENRLILYEPKLDDGSRDGIDAAIDTVHMFQHTPYLANPEYVKWKNARMHPRLHFYLRECGTIRELTP